MLHFIMYLSTFHLHQLHPSLSLAENPPPLQFCGFLHSLKNIQWMTKAKDPVFDIGSCLFMAVTLNVQISLLVAIHMTLFLTSFPFLVSGGTFFSSFFWSQIYFKYYS